jgi:hypothetical protein
MARRKIHPNSRPVVSPDPRSRFAETKDGWRQRLRIGRRLGNGAVLTARQVVELSEFVEAADALGWRDPQQENTA